MVIYTDSFSSMLAIKNNRENYPILNQIYDILTKLHNYGKSLCIWELKEMKKQTKQQNKQ